MGVYVVKVHRKGIVVLPAKLRRKYGIREGSELVIVEEEGRLVLVPRLSIEELYGLAREYGSVIDEMIKELEEERRLEARA